MSTYTDISGGVVLRASDIPNSTGVRIMNDDIRNDIRDELFATYPNTMQGSMILNMVQIGALTAAIASPAVSGSIEEGTYRYKVSYLTGDEETQVGTTSTSVVINASGTNGKIELTAVPTGGDNINGRRIYRQKDGVGEYLLVTTLADNTTTTYTDNNTQASLIGIAKQGFSLPFDFYEEIALKDVNRSIRIKKGSEGSTEGKAYAWIDYGDKAGSITVVASDGSTGLRFTSANHGLQTGEKVTTSTFSDTAYNLTDQAIVRVDEDNFDITTGTFTSTGTGQWDGAETLICFPPGQPWTGSDKLVLLYWKEIADVAETGALPYPRALHPRLLPIFRMGVSFYYLAGKPGNQDSDQVDLAQERYMVARSNIFSGSISTIFDDTN